MDRARHHHHAAAPRESPEFEVLWGLFTATEPAEQERLCGRLLSLPPRARSRYLLQLVYLAVCRPSGPLERAIVELCARSFSTAAQVSWLLLALSEDQPGNRHVRLFRDACEHAALSGGAVRGCREAGLLSAAARGCHSAQRCASAQRPSAPPPPPLPPVAQPTQPHYLTAWPAQLEAEQQQQQQQQQQQPSPISCGDAPPDGASPFAPGAVAAFSSSPGADSSPPPGSAELSGGSGWGAASGGALAASLTGSGLSLSGLSLSGHRFRESLDLELMRHASQDVAHSASAGGAGPGAAAAAAAAASAAAAAAGGKPVRRRDAWQLQEQQQQQEQEQQLEQEQRREWQQQHEQAAGAGPSHGWALPGSAAAEHPSLQAYLAARTAELDAALGAGQGVSALLSASAEVAAGNGQQGVGWLVTHEEELLTTSMLLEMPPRSPRHAAGRDSYLATLDLVDALCETSASLTRFPPEQRRHVLRNCLSRIDAEVAHAAEQGVAVRYPIGGCRTRVLRLLVDEAVILNSRDKAPFLLLLETEEDAGFVDEVDEPVQAGSGGGQQPAQQAQQARRSTRGGVGASPLGRGAARPALHAAQPTAGSEQQQQLAPAPPPAAQQDSGSWLEQQMQQAAALLRGEPGCSVVRLVLTLHGAEQQRSWGGGSGGDPDAGPWTVSSGPVRVRLEVLAPPVGSLGLDRERPAGRKARRLPSLEAIDIIAGKLGTSVPPPSEIGPPLKAQGGQRSSGGGSDATLAPAPGSPGSAAHLGAVAEGAAACAGNGHGTPQRAAPGAAAPPQQPASAGWWGYLRSSLSGARQAQEQPQGEQVQQQAQQARQEQQQEQQEQQEQRAAVDAEELSQQMAAVYGEPWAERCARVRAASPHGGRPGWGLAGAIVKSGDDCRQELLALQLIKEFQDIWAGAARAAPAAAPLREAGARARAALRATETAPPVRPAPRRGPAAGAGLPLWVHPYEVLPTSSGTALIALIPDATSVHSAKARSAAVLAAAAAAAAGRAPGSGASTPRDGGGGGGGVGAGAAPPPPPPPPPGGVSLSEHFFARWRRGTPECVAAQRRFVESLAGYSLVTYLLQVKDRHNGNIMIDATGRLVHIDYGFLLGHAPGGNWVTFEAAPMKLSREALEVLDSDAGGQASELFDYFKVLVIQGFLAARKERARIVGLVRIMAECSRPAPGCGGGDAPDAGGGAAAAAGAPGGLTCPPWPCFRAGPERVVAALEGRFAPGLSDGGVVSHVLRLVSASLDAWSTRQYDAYQRVLNGIL
ncbi:PI4KB1 [Scenedesmus sp. PABB004]|nr:PI4KB1 [Scenedesmus sp. PABB004]